MTSRVKTLKQWVTAGSCSWAEPCSLHGTEKNSWTKLAKTAAAGSNTIEVLNPGDWKKGDQIVLASTDFDPHQAERRTISSVSGKVITLDQNLQFMHYGQVTFGVDE